MAICGYEFEDGVVCGQSLGHEKFDVPHIRWDEGAAYWAKRITEQRAAEKAQKEEQ